MQFTPPKDWPKDGEIDLNIHDLPHQSSTTEWWYVNSHCKGKDGKEYSIFASFFRKLLKYDKSKDELVYAYSITWAIIDATDKKYYANSVVDRKAPEIGLERIRQGEIVNDNRIRKAAIEMLEKGVVPYPDRLFEGEVVCSLDKLDLQYDTNSYTKLTNGNYALKLYDKEHDVACDLELEPQTKPIRHGDNGVVSGISAEDMFYYFIPKNIMTGSINIKGQEIELESGTAWYDHEFGRHRDEVKNADIDLTKDVAWDWIAAQLDDNSQLTAYNLVNTKTNENSGSYLILIDSEGNRRQVKDFTFTSIGEAWTSTRTFQDYPTHWVIESKEIDLKLEIEAYFPEQEFATVISKPAFWEGKVSVKGTKEGKSVAGPGFIERSGFSALNNLEDFFKIVSRETIKSVDFVIPHNPSREKLSELVSKKEQTHYIESVETSVFQKALIEPIRTIIDRGGKSWRSYAALACCDIVGGNSQEAIQWLSLPELMHVGSLIVDDVQDQSDIRRGRPTCHKIYGEPIAINAGSAAYFIGQISVYNADIPDAKKLKIYHMYFETLRAAHSGQALDLYGLDYMMDDVVENGKGDLLVERSIAIHRLKSAAPASYLAKIGAVLGNGTEEQIEGLGVYYDALGIAFQIIDDTLNIKGFQDDLKTVCEDITAGKITYPIAVAMSFLDKADRKRLWEIVKSKTDDLGILSEAVQIINKFEVLEKCTEDAKNIVNKAWKKLDPLVKDSMVKLNLRAFSWYILDRTY